MVGNGLQIWCIFLAFIRKQCAVTVLVSDILTGMPFKFSFSLKKKVSFVQPFQNQRTSSLI